MGSSFGGSIKLTGESEYRKALKEIDSTLRVLGSELKEVSSQYDKNDRSVENLAKQNEVLTKKMSEQQEKVEVLKNALKAAAEETGENSETAKKYQIQLNNAQAELNNLNRQLESNKKDMEAAEKATEDEKAAVRDVGDEAERSSKKFEALGGILKATVAAAAAVGAATAAAGKKIWDLANETAEAGDEIDKMSQKIGISKQAYQEWRYVFNRCGADINDLQGGMTKLSGIIVDAVEGSDSAAQKLSAVGLSIKDLNNKSQTEQLNIVISALQKMESGAKRTSAANDLFGKSASNMAAVLNMTAKETAALKQEAADYGMIMSDEAVAASVNFEDIMTKLDGTISGVKGRLISELLPGLSQITDGFSGLIAGSDMANDKIKSGVSDLIKSIKVMSPQFVEILTTVGETIIDNLPDLLDSVITMIFDPQKGLLNSDNIGKLVEGAGKVVVTLFTRLPDIISGLLNAIPNIIEKLFDTEKGFLSEGNVKKLVEGAARTVGEIVSHLFEITASLISAIPGIVKSIVGGTLSAIADLLGVNTPINTYSSEGLITAGKVYNAKPLTSDGKSNSSDNGLFTIKGKPAAKGGVITKPTLILGGDAGAEAFVPLENNTQWISRVAEKLFEMNQQVAAGMITASAPLYATAAPAAEPPVSINIQFGDVQMASDLDVRDVADQISGIIAAKVISQGRRFA